MQMSLPRQPLHRGHCIAVERLEVDHAGPDRDPIQKHRARATLPLATSALSPGQGQILTQRVKECPPRRLIDCVLIAIDDESHHRATLARPCRYR